MGLFNNMKDVKKAVWLYEGHRCSSCGAENLTKQKIILRYRYDEIGLSRSEAQRKSAAEQKLSDAENELVKRAADPEDIKKYYDLNLLGKCEKCGHKEPWSRMRTRWVEAVFNTLVAMSFVALILGIAQIFTAGSVLMLIPAAGLIVVTVAVKLLQKNRRKGREKKIAALGEQYIPFLTADGGEFRDKYPEVEPDKLVKIEPSAYYQVIE